MRARSAQLRHAGQAAATVTTAYLVLTVAGWPHLGWVLVGILTTLRPSWPATESRVVKRSVGMFAGFVITAAMLALEPVLGYWGTVAAIALFGGIARPMRQYNYGYWPLLGTSVLLLLVSLEEPLTVSDSATRVINNLLGAAVTLIAITALWPHHDQRPTTAGPEAEYGVK